jgi:hypothetical protein
MNEYDDWEPPRWFMDALALIGLAALSFAFGWLVS